MCGFWVGSDGCGPWWKGGPLGRETVPAAGRQALGHMSGWIIGKRELM